MASKTYEWVLEGDIAACFDEISHSALMDRVRARIGDKRVLALVKAFLKAGILTERSTAQDSITGTPQGGILSPLLANVALSVLDEHFAEIPGGPQTSPKRRFTRRQNGLSNYRLIRYADDFVILVSGTRAHTEALLPEVAAVLSTVGLRLSEDKTLITHIDEGFDFFGLAHPASPQTRHRPALRLQLSSQEGPSVHQGQVQGDLPVQRQPAAGSPAAQTQPGAAGLDHLLPSRSVCPGLPLPAHDRLASSIRMAPAQTPHRGLEGTPPPLLRRRLVATRGKGRFVQPRFGSHHTLPPSGNNDPFALAQRDLRKTTGPRDLWRAGCGANPHVRFGRAAWRNGPGVIPKPRSRPTPPRRGGGGRVGPPPGSSAVFRGYRWYGGIACGDRRLSW